MIRSIFPASRSRDWRGCCLTGGLVKRVMVFVDAQNFYRSARRAFFQPTDSFVHGQVRPDALGQLLAARDPDRGLVQVRLYTGRPDQRLQSKSYAANLRQCDAWESAGCFVFHRPLRYPPGGGAPVEKGIDVAMAVDLVLLATKDAYDIAILCTATAICCRRCKRCWPRPRQSLRRHRGEEPTHIPGCRYRDATCGVTGCAGWTMTACATTRITRPELPGTLGL